ncbi:Dihydrofolate reductase [compost metagenome]
MTEVDADVEGDAFFPAFDSADWRMIEQVSHNRDEKNSYDFKICTYIRNAVSK